MCWYLHPFLGIKIITPKISKNLIIARATVEEELILHNNTRVWITTLRPDIWVRLHSLPVECHAVHSVKLLPLFLLDKNYNCLVFFYIFWFPAPTEYIHIFIMYDCSMTPALARVIRTFLFIWSLRSAKPLAIFKYLGRASLSICKNLLLLLGLRLLTHKQNLILLDNQNFLNILC